MTETYRVEFMMDMTNADDCREVLGIYDVDGQRPFELDRLERAAYDFRERHAYEPWARNHIWQDWITEVLNMADHCATVIHRAAQR